MKIGFYSGSFNPIHSGHISLANYILNHTDLDEIWLVVSPHNPLKQKELLIDDDIRLQMTALAVEDFPRLKVSDVEFSLPKPSYTIDTLDFLSKEYPNDEFVLIIGADNLDIFHLWKNYQELLKNYRILVYPREGFKIQNSKFLTKPNGKAECKIQSFSRKLGVEYIDAPLFNISSSEIREKIKNKEDISAFLPPKVLTFITQTLKSPEGDFKRAK